MRNVFKLTFLAATVMGLVACGGDDIDGTGISSNTNTTTNSDNSSNSNTNTTNTSDSTQNEPLSNDMNALMSMVENNGSSLLGHMDITAEQENRGFIDHSIDALNNGAFQLAKDIKAAFDDKRNPTHEGFSKLEIGSDVNDCTEALGVSSAIECYRISGDEQIKNVLFKYFGTSHPMTTFYSRWNFSTYAKDLYNIQADTTRFIQPTIIYIYKNENNDKDYSHILIKGAFRYPYKQIPPVSPEKEPTYRQRFVVGTFDVNKQKDLNKYIIQSADLTVLTNDETKYSTAEISKIVIKSSPNDSYLELLNNVITLNLANTIIQKLNATDISTAPTQPEISGAFNFVFTPAKVPYVSPTFLTNFATQKDIVFNHTLTSATDGQNKYGKVQIQGTATQATDNITVTLTLPQNQTFVYPNKTN